MASSGEGDDTLKARIDELEEELQNKDYENEELADTIVQLQEEVKQLKESSGGSGDNGSKAASGSPAERINELEEAVLAKSSEVVEQAEKTMQAKREVGDLQEQLKELQADIEKSSGKRFKNLKLGDLVRIRLKQDDGPAPSRAPSRASGRSSPGAGGGAGGGAGEGAADSRPRANMSDQEQSALKNRNRYLQAKVEALESELAVAADAANGVHAARSKVQDFAERVRNEKAAKEKAERQTAKANNKVEQLMEHVEKLMVHLKHEAAAKAKAYEAQRKADREIQLLKARNGALSRKNAARDRVIAELREGARILEDQLRLMDEKYIELRNKLDWTRQHSQKEVKRIQQQAAKLRARVMMSRTADSLPLSSPGGRRSRSRRSNGSPSSRRPRTSVGGAGGARAGDSSGGGGSSSSQLRDVRDMTLPMDPSMDADPSVPWSNTKLSRTYGLQQ